MIGTHEFTTKDKPEINSSSDTIVAMLKNLLGTSFDNSIRLDWVKELNNNTSLLYTSIKKLVKDIDDIDVISLYMDTATFITDYKKIGEFKKNNGTWTYNKTTNQ